jgi:hypothetical protein
VTSLDVAVGMRVGDSLGAADRDAGAVLFELLKSISGSLIDDGLINMLLCCSYPFFTFMCVSINGAHKAFVYW